MSTSRVQTHIQSTPLWMACTAIALAVLAGFVFALTILLIRGVGIWGINVPVGWGFAITNFIWWIGIGHAGTFISAILFLTRQEWRTSISRISETMTIFAVICAGLFPLIHVGRPWLAYWIFPYYDTMNLWPQFRSPLVWDLFAVSTYLLTSLFYFYLGLIPDLAIYRDQARSRFQEKFYGALAMGWRGSQSQWNQYRSAYIILAAIATPLVISVHSIVGLDFAVANVAGWHSTILPPFFVGGAIFSGFAMVLTLCIPLRRALRLEKIITLRHLDLCARFIMAMGWIVVYGYLMEAFTAYYSGDPFEIALVQNRYFGSYAVLAWLMIFCNGVAPQILWSARIRQNPLILFFLSLVINVGMWLERFIIVVTGLYRDYLPSSWHVFIPTPWDWAFLFGSMGLFASLYLVFTRIFPILPITELRHTLVHAPDEIEEAP